MKTEDDLRVAWSAVTVLGAAARLGVAEANHMARWIYGSLFSLNAAGAATCVALEVSRPFKLMGAICFLSGIFFALLSGARNGRVMARSAQVMNSALEYWIDVQSGQERNPDREAEQAQAIATAGEGTKAANRFMWLSFSGFVLGVLVISFGIATSR